MLFQDFELKAIWMHGSSGLPGVVRAFVSDASLSMVLYRTMQVCAKSSLLSPLAALLCKINAVICGAVIGRNANFKEGFVILHSVGIVINSVVTGGRNIIIENNVVIGAEKGKCPNLGNNIFIGSGAKIFGQITIGDNVTIGANAVVNKSVPSNVTVAGVPAKIISKNTSPFSELVLKLLAAKKCKSRQ